MSLCSNCKKSSDKPVGGCNVTVSCGTCHSTSHASCIEGWKGKISNHGYDLPGLVFYCSSCLPKLKEYVYGPTLAENMDECIQQLKSLTNLIGENLTKTKSYAQVLDENKQQTAEIKTILNTVKSSVDVSQENIKQSINDSLPTSPELQELKVLVNKLDHSKKLTPDPKIPEIDIRNNVIIHGVEEGTKDSLQKRVLDLLHDYNIHYSYVTSIIRLGRPKPDQKRPRPIKVSFISQVVKREFATRFAHNRMEGIFITNDLTKEQQKQEFDLRNKKRQLQSENENKKFRIHNGKIEEQTEGKWQEI